MSARPSGGSGRSPSAEPPRADRGRRALRQAHPRTARLVGFVPLALVVSVLVLLLGLPWWTLALGVAALAYVLLFHS